MNAINEKISVGNAEITQSNNVLDRKLSEKNEALKRLVAEEEKLKAMIVEKNANLEKLTEQETQQEARIDQLMKEIKDAQNEIFDLQGEVADKNKQNMGNMQVEADLKSEIASLINSIYHKKQIVKENTTEFEREMSTKQSKKSNQLVFKSVAPGPKKRYYDPNVKDGCDCKCSIM